MTQRVKLTEKQIKDTITSVQTIMGAVNVAQLEYFQLLPDHQKSLVQIKQRSRRLLEDLESIKKLLFTMVNLKEDKDHVDYELGHELHRLFVYFSTMEYEQLKDFNNLIYQHPTVDVEHFAKSI